MMRMMVVVGAVGLVEEARGMVVAGIRRGVDGGDGLVLMSLYCGSYGHFTLYVLI
jgi:mannose/cellobiose epimerase-like protein (N-acyl-D-glucosamine 2-epimerase family)